MGRKSTVTRLPVSLRSQIDKALAQGRMTLDELHAFVAAKCAAQGEEAPSRSALWRYSSNFEAAAKTMRENRDMARALAQELGADSVESEQGRLLVEMLRGMCYRALQDRVADPAAKVDPAEIDKLARSFKNLSQAMSLEADFAKRIREEARREANEQIRARVRELGSAAAIKELSDEELARKLAELTADMAHGGA